MITRSAALLGLLLAFAQAPLLAQTTGPLVRFHTTFGDIDVQLLSNSAPATVQNFMNYLNRGAFERTFIHRSVPGFIVQGGGFQYRDGNLTEIPPDPPVVNEFRVSNTRGTLAMAKLGNDPNSATSQWFFNLGDNSGNLDSQNGGFTVFGRVVDPGGMAVVDTIASVPRYPLDSPFDDIPLINYAGGPVQAHNLVMINSITVLEAPPPSNITISGVISTGDFGALPYAAPGSFIEIYGTDLAPAEVGRSWRADDFVNNNAPTLLDGVSVTIGGRAAYVAYASPTQVNVQVPASAPQGGPVAVVVSHSGQSGTAFMFPIRSIAGGLLAPKSFEVDGKQFVAAINASKGDQFLNNGSIPDLPTVTASPGDTLTIYGVGFGAVRPSSVQVAGQFAPAGTAITNSIEFRFGGVPAPPPAYAGLVAGLVGVYQFNVEVPAGAPSGDVALEVLLRGEPIGQSLLISVE